MRLKNSVYWQVFGDVWQYFKEFYPPQSNDEYWDAAVGEIENLIGKYQGGAGEKLAQDLILAVLTELERLNRIDGRGKSK